MSSKNLDRLNPVVAEIWTEGKTDWRLLERAAQVLNLDFPIKFHKTDRDMGGDKLLKSLQTFAEKAQPWPMIFIFDHDQRDIVAQVSGSQTVYKDWSNNVFSFAIPTPSHRLGYENICIEMYFTDEEVQQEDSHGRHLFLTSSFHENSGKHTSDPTIHYARTGYLKGCTLPEKAKIIDGEVYDAQSQNIALSKIDFAEYVAKAVVPFDGFRFDEFGAIFSIVKSIITASAPRTRIYCPDLHQFLDEVDLLEPQDRFPLVFRRICDLLTLALQIFTITTVRVYEDVIVNEPHDVRKRVTPIKKIVTESYRRPTLDTQAQLAEKCFYLIDGKAPGTLVAMKECLGQTITTGPLGQLWDDLETLFPSDSEGARIVNKAELKRDFLRKVIPQIAHYASKPHDVIEQGLSRTGEFPHIQIAMWKQALIQVSELLEPFFLNPIVFRGISNRDPISDEFIVEVRNYRDGVLIRTFERVQRIEDEYERKSSELVTNEGLRIHLYPFLLVRDDALFSYRRTLSSGYEYYSVLLDRIYVDSTKKKFSQTLFQVGSKQELFWTDVLPMQSPVNGIRANIPDEGPYEFVGRRKQISQIKEEIINIVNENGIVYGPGGIGKTALIIQVTKELYAEKDVENVLFDNIIWVSAKSNFYDYMFDTIEEREPQVKSLDSILFAILRFFDLGSLEEYSFEDRKELTMEFLMDNRILLIVDNFESIPPAEAGKIVEFFGTKVKKALRLKPYNFKIILTSRELVPSGFRQIELLGLDKGDSKRLIDSLFKRYRATRVPLTDEQKTVLLEQTKGIPILIKHCIARVYEYNEPFDAVVRGLPRYSANIVQFSFKEILEQLEKGDDRIPLRILILLEIVEMPMMIRQIVDILQVQEHAVEEKIPLLLGFECIKRVNQDNQEKYLINDAIRLLTKSLVKEHRDLTQEIRQSYYRNFSFDKQLDYTSEEEDVLDVFEGYIKHREFADAEAFIKKELKKRPNSVLLNFYYARYLKNRRNESDSAIKILEGLRDITGNHPLILKLLFSCYAESSIPRFESADNLIGQIQFNLGDYLEDDFDFQIEMARFYVRWSASIKNTRGIDRYEENQRRSKYKELAHKALDILVTLESLLNQKKPKNISFSRHEIYYRMAECHYNLWDYDRALKMIDKAIALAQDNMNFASEDDYRAFRKYIQSTSDFYARNPGLDQRK